MGVGWPGRWVGEAAVVSGIACSAWSAAMLLLFLGQRARRVCSRLWMTAARRAASVWAAVPNTRQDSGLKLPSCLIMPLTPSTGLRPA